MLPPLLCSLDAPGDTELELTGGRGAKRDAAEKSVTFLLLDTAKAAAENIEDEDAEEFLG